MKRFREIRAVEKHKICINCGEISKGNVFCGDECKHEFNLKHTIDVLKMDLQDARILLTMARDYAIETGCDQMKEEIESFLTRINPPNAQADRAGKKS
jgi:predicted nucleic acid-binding Zn ribbon protein